MSDNIITLRFDIKAVKKIVDSTLDAVRFSRR
jgi:hypothetical protein